MCTADIVNFVTNRKVLLITILTSLTACGVANKQRVPSQNSAPTIQRNNILSALNQAHTDWKGAPYVLGGSGIGGVDCSSFSQIVFEDYFGIELPRNTRQQLQVGSSVRRNYMQPGDLVFFRTGRNLMHVGIVMEGDRFLHASVSSGVMISRLNQRYWASKYLTTRRIL
jgi:cell wall-associated NlpC family hydrolase